MFSSWPPEKTRVRVDMGDDGIHQRPVGTTAARLIQTRALCLSHTARARADRDPLKQLFITYNQNQQWQLS